MRRICADFKYHDSFNWSIRVNLLNPDVIRVPLPLIKKVMYGF